MRDVRKVFAIRYAGWNGRCRTYTFLMDADRDAPHLMDYFIWRYLFLTETAAA